MTTAPRLSLLDQSPAGPAGHAAAIQASVRRARLAEELGLARIWFAEHHGHAAFAGTSPLVLAAAALGATETVRVGTGGVLVGFHSPHDVASAFRVLEQGFPGRVDAGLGRASADLGTYLDHTAQVVHRLADGGPGVWVLGVGRRSAVHADELGVGYAYGHFFNPTAPAEAFAGRERGLGDVLAVRVVVRDDEDEARRAADAFVGWRTRRDLGHNQPLPGVVPPSTDPLAGLPADLVARNAAAVLAGTPAQVVDRMSQLVDVSGAPEVMMTLPEPDEATHEHGLRSLVEAFSRRGSLAGARRA